MPNFLKKIFFSVGCCFLLLTNNVSGSQQNSTTVSIMALTWNVGNTTAKDSVVQGFIDEINKINPDVILLGTQEELAKEGEKLKDKLAAKLGGKYKIVADNSQTTSAGANNALKTAVLAGAQETPVSKMANLKQNRSGLSVLVKAGVNLEAIKKRIDYPPGSKKSNNGFILIEGNIIKNPVQPNRVTLPISIASVHLNSRSDKIRRTHANDFFKKQKFSNPNKQYNDILLEAKRFHLIMGDFNEREYFMKNNSVIDRGYLTNFMAYGFDFSHKQLRASPVYGTYGFTKFGNSPEILKDPRKRVHNAKGGFLDRIVYTTGFSVTSDPNQYGAVVVSKNEFDPKNRMFYAGSDHLPIIRHFEIKIPNSNSQNISKKNTEIVKSYIKRRLPNFQADITALINGIKNVSSLEFYDSKQPVDSTNLKSKQTALETLQTEVKKLEDKIDKSEDTSFLTKVHNKITECNKSRNSSFEKIDSTPPSQWYIPLLLDQDTYNCYQSAVSELNGSALPNQGKQWKKGIAPHIR